MCKKMLLSFLGIALILMVISCERLDEPAVRYCGEVDCQPLADGIASEHGRFVSATTNNRFEVTLWFERPDRTVVGVRVNLSLGVIVDEVTIPRN